MAHIDNLDHLEIDPAALDLISGSVAEANAVLAIRIEERGLYVLTPVEKIEKQPAILDKLEYILERPVIADTANEADLLQAIALHYSNFVGKLDNCPIEFKYRCPNKWSALEVTDEPFIRFCSECSQNVYFCMSDEEARNRGRKGQCVAWGGISSMTTTGIVDFTQSSPPNEGN